MKISTKRNPYKLWRTKTKLEFLQRRIIVYSLMYYELNENVISDYDYDQLAKMYFDLVCSTKESILVTTKYWYCMKDFTPATGFDIPYKLNATDKHYLQGIANYILKIKKE